MARSWRPARSAVKSTTSRSKTCLPARSSRRRRARGVPGSADVAVTGGPRAFTGRVLLAPVRAAAAVVAWGLAVLVGDVLRIRRAHAEAAMARAGIADPGRTARAMYRSLGRGLVELVAMAFS